MIRTVVLGPKTAPLIKSYNYKDTIIVINKHTNTTELISAKETSPYNHLIITNGTIREVLIAITSKERLTQKQVINIINKTPI